MVTLTLTGFCLKSNLLPLSSTSAAPPWGFSSSSPFLAFLPSAADLDDEAALAFFEAGGAEEDEASAGRGRT